MKKRALLCFLILPAMFAAAEEPEITRFEDDQNQDGAVDYVLDMDSEGNKVYEAMDYNMDGCLDDFYYYVKGILDHRELDSNYDGKVDSWVYLSEGIYILRYERDLDFDGVVDQVRDYTDTEE